MATRDDRIARFTSDEEPEPDIALELLCEDHNGTYVLPFPCRRVGNEWWNQSTEQIIEAKIVGWRMWTRS